MASTSEPFVPIGRPIGVMLAWQAERARVAWEAKHRLTADDKATLAEALRLPLDESRLRAAVESLDRSILRRLWSLQVAAITATAIRKELDKVRVAARSLIAAVRDTSAVTRDLIAGRADVEGFEWLVESRERRRAVRNPTLVDEWTWLDDVFALQDAAHYMHETEIDADLVENTMTRTKLHRRGLSSDPRALRLAGYAVSVYQRFAVLGRGDVARRARVVKIVLLRALPDDHVIGPSSNFEALARKAMTEYLDNERSDAESRARNAALIERARNHPEE